MEVWYRFVQGYPYQIIFIKILSDSSGTRLDMAAKDSEFTYIRQVVIGLRLPQWM
jgi:hypothetical protein